jgi:hypothetical protein
MGKRIKLRPKNADLIISPRIMSIFRKKKGVYAVAKRKGLQATNVYRKIYSCDDALLRIKKVLWMVDHDLKYEIIEKKNPIDQK